jgi:hypothetical protein
MVVMSAPLFFLGSLLEKTNNEIAFSFALTKRLMMLAGVALLMTLAVSGLLALHAAAANNTLKWALARPPAEVLAQIEADSWRVDQHFNRSLPATDRKSAATRFQTTAALPSAASPNSVQQLEQAPAKILNVRRIPGKIVFLVESNVDLKYGVFLLRSADDKNIVFFRKAVDWSNAQTYMLIFNTADLDKNINAFTLSLKPNAESFTLEPNVPIGSVTF